MKKLLYGTTAIVGVGALAAGNAAHAQEEGVQIGVTGWIDTYYGFADVDEVGTQDFSHAVGEQTGQVNFVGETTLDNGVTVGARFEIESFGHPADEQLVFFEGNFGEISLGLRNSAGYSMHLAGPHFAAGPVALNTGWQTFFIPPPANQQVNFRTPSTGTYLDTHNDANTIAWFSPRVAGFQFGASYTPDLSGSGAVSSTNQAAFFGNFDTETVWHDAWSVGLSYVQSFDAVEFGISGGFNQSQAPDSATIAKDSKNQYLTGGYVSFGGFTVGASFSREDSSAATEGHAINAAASYSTGPWTLTAEGIVSEVEGASAHANKGFGASERATVNVPSGADNGNDKYHGISVGAGYTMGPGILLAADVMYLNWDEENTSQDQDGWAAVLGTTVSF